MEELDTGSLEEGKSLSVSDSLEDNGQCEFRAVYNDLENYEYFTPWRCEERKENTGTNKNQLFCIFHDRTHIWDITSLQRFEDKLEKHNQTKEALFCIGYYFPVNISFNHRLKDEEMQENLPNQEPQKYQEYDYPIYLCDAEFAGSAEFSKCIFKKPFNISGAIFRKQALFRWAKFLQQFYPRNTKFYDNVNFRNTKFLNADFHDTLFYDKANFHDVKFYGIKTETRFLDVKFQGKANFANTKFYGHTEFKGTTFREARFSQSVEFQQLTKFRSVVFENGENIDFAVINLSNVSFLGTDITRIKFHESVKWNSTDDEDDRLTVIDERELREMNVRHLLNWEQFPEDDMYREQMIEFLETRFGVTSISMDSRFEKSKYKKIVTIYKTRKIKGSCQILPKPGKAFGFIVLDSKKLARLIIGGVTCCEFFVKKDSNGTNLYYSNYPPIESVKAIYRGLRENYEYRLRYDEAGKFFVKEMELKRMYNSNNSENFQKKERERLKLPNMSGNLVPPEKNNIIIRNVLSLTAWYRILALYGEDLKRPVLAGIVILTVSTIFWLIQINPSGEPSLTNTVGLANATNSTVWNKALERTMADFLPLLSSPDEIKIGLIDFIIKIVGGAVTFALLAIGLRRKFERRFRH